MLNTITLIRSIQCLRSHFEEEFVALKQRNQGLGQHVFSLVLEHVQAAEIAHGGLVELLLGVEHLLVCLVSLQIVVSLVG